MTDKVFLDSNLWIYLHAQNPIDKSHKVRTLVANNFASVVVSTQILGEIYHVLTRKRLTTPEIARQLVLEMVTKFPVLEIGTVEVLQALDVTARFGYSYWDSLIISTALNGGCEAIYSEDMQHNQKIENKLYILNPFLL